jgi:hypothetical protein
LPSDDDTFGQSSAAWLIGETPNCGGELKAIVAILERAAIERILKHLGLEAKVPPRAPARGQMPLQDF